MGIIITPKSEIDAYFESEAMSQSLLKKLIGGMDKFLEAQEKPEKELYYEENGSFVLGSGVDTRLTGTKHQFDEEFYVSQIDVKPSDKEMSITHHVFDAMVENYPEAENHQELNKYPGFIENAVEEHNWQPKWKPETKFNKICEVCTEYFEDLKRAYGKQILSKEQEAIIDSVVMSFKTNPRTSRYFDREAMAKAENMDFYFQLPIYFTYRGRECKALLDFVVVYKNDQGEITVVEPFDIKTMQDRTVNFISNVKRFRYDIQGAWYKLALHKWLNTQKTVERPRIQNFQFLVESTNYIGSPLVYMLDDNIERIGKEGRAELKLIDTDFFKPGTMGELPGEIIISKEIKGYEQLMTEYLWYEGTDWQEDMRTEGRPVLSLGWNGINA